MKSQNNGVNDIPNETKELFHILMQVSSIVKNMGHNMVSILKEVSEFETTDETSKEIEENIVCLTGAMFAIVELNSIITKFANGENTVFVNTQELASKIMDNKDSEENEKLMNHYTRLNAESTKRAIKNILDQSGFENCYVVNNSQN